MRDEDDNIFLRTEISVSHDSMSDGPAFSIALEKTIPEPLLVNYPYYLESDGLSVVEDEFEIQGFDTIIDIHIDVLYQGETMNLTYFTMLNQSHKTDINLTRPIFIEYTTIKQEGIGLMVRVISYSYINSYINCIYCLLYSMREFIPVNLLNLLPAHVC